MKKVLFTIQWYPPKDSANVLCDDKIIQELQKNGEYEIHCLVYKIPNAPVEEEVNGVKVHRFSKGLFFDYYIKNKEKGSKLLEKCNRFFLRIKQFLTIPIYPIYEPFAVKRFAKKAIKLHKKEKFDLVISEHNGLDSLYAGYALKKYDWNIKFIPILWDAFSGKTLAKYLPKGFAQKKLLKAENKLLSIADSIVAMKSSKRYHEEYSKQKPYFHKYRFLDIPGVIEKKEASIEASFIKEGKINVVYSGILSLPDRNPEYIITLLNASSIAKNCNLIFLSMGNGVEKLSKWKKDFLGTIIVHGYVGREEINAIYHKTDILINLGGPNPTMVPSKIFEYMSYGKPILSTYYIDAETSKSYLKKYPLGLCIDERKPMDENLKLLEAFIQNSLGKRVAFDVVERTFPENTPKSYVKLIQEVLE